MFNIHSTHVRKVMIVAGLHVQS